MEVPQSNNPGDRLIYEIEQFLLANDAYQFLHLFLYRIVNRIKSGEIRLILVPIDDAFERLVKASGKKTTDQIQNIQEALDILANHVSRDQLNLSNNGAPLFTAINGNPFGRTSRDFDLLNTIKSAKFGLVSVIIIYKMITAPGQLDRLKSVQQTETQLNTNKTYDRLPLDVIRIIALELSLGDIFNHCLTSKRFNTVICNNENFWHEKLRKEYPWQQVMIGGTWRKTYESFSRQLFITGNGDYDNLNKNIHIVALAHILPKRIPPIAQVTAVASGEFHIAVIANGELYTFGNGFDGQLGLGNIKQVEHPTQVIGYTEHKITAVSCSNAHTVVLNSNGQVYTFGNGEYGQLGLGDFNSHDVPMLVPGLNNATQVVATNAQTGVIADRRLYMLGMPADMDDRKKKHASPIRVPKLKDVTCVSLSVGLSAVINNGKIYIYIGTFNPKHTADKPTLIVDDLPGVSYVACGDMYVLAIANGQLYSYGYNANGQLGVGDNRNRNEFTLVPGLDNVSLVACGEHHSAIIANGQLYTCGANYNGELGLSGVNAIVIDNSIDVGVRNIPTLVEGFDDVTFVSCYDNRTCIVGIPTPGSAVNETKEERIGGTRKIFSQAKSRAVPSNLKPSTIYPGQLPNLMPNNNNNILNLQSLLE